MSATPSPALLLSFPSTPPISLNKPFSPSLPSRANCLKAWGRLEDALALHKKEEALCLELGNKQGLGFCYWHWGLLARSDPNAANEKLTAALTLFTELGMPHERDAVAAELADLRKP